MSLHWQGLERCPCGCAFVTWFERWRWDGGTSVRVGPVVVAWRART